EADRVDLARLEHVDVRQIPHRQPEVRVEAFDDDHGALDAELGKPLRGLFRLRGADGERLDEDETLLPEQLGQHRSQRAAVHLAMDLLVVVAGACRERAAAAYPDRAPRRAGPRAAGALLAPWLDAAASDLGAGLLRLRAGAPAREIGHDDLMNERLVERRRERRVGELYRFAITVQIDLHFPSRGLPALTAGRTSTRPEIEPGTAPLTSSRLRSASTRTTSRFGCVVRAAPRWPDIFLPLNTRPGDWFWPIEPGARCEIELPWVASCVRKLWRFTVPA